MATLRDALDEAVRQSEAEQKGISIIRLTPNMYILRPTDSIFGPGIDIVATVNLAPLAPSTTPDIERNISSLIPTPSELMEHLTDDCIADLSESHAQNPLPRRR